MLRLEKMLELDYNDVKLHILANLLRLLVDIYGLPKAKQKLDKVEGEEIVVEFPALEGSIVIRPHGGRLIAEVGDSEEAITRIRVKARDEQIFPVMEDIIKSSQRWGILKIFFKYILTRKIGFKGSIGAMINTFKAMMIGDHEMFKRAKMQVEAN
ncbi:MAG: hypothetical protein ACTSRL_01195 [Candidatus Helarchaeota archaeon]